MESDDAPSKQSQAPPLQTQTNRSGRWQIPKWLQWLLLGAALSAVLIWKFYTPLSCAIDYRLTEVRFLLIMALATGAAALVKKLTPLPLSEKILGFGLGSLIPIFLLTIASMFAPDMPPAACEPVVASPVLISAAPAPTILPTGTPGACIQLPPLADTVPYFYIYTDADAADNHFFPSVFMGDVGDITVIEDAADNIHSGTTAIKVIYDAKGRGDPTGEYRCRLGETTTGPCKYAGVYWVNPVNNIGTIHVGGYNLTGFKKLTFWALSPDGIDLEFQVGGIGASVLHQPDCPDSYAARGRAPLKTLQPEWKSYEVMLEEPADLSYIIGGLYWSANWPNNDITADSPRKLVFYLDDIRFER